MPTLLVHSPSKPVWGWQGNSSPQYVACVIIFIQFVERGSNRILKIISNNLHNHSFFSIIYNMVSNCIMQAWGLAYARHEMHEFSHPIISHFCLDSEVFSFVLHIKLVLPHPLVLKVTHCICGQPLDPTRIHLLCYSHNGVDYIPWYCLGCLHLHRKKTWGFMFRMSKPMHFHHLPLSFLVNMLTSCY